MARSPGEVTPRSPDDYRYVRFLGTDDEWHTARFSHASEALRFRDEWPLAAEYHGDEDRHDDAEAPPAFPRPDVEGSL